MGELLTRGTVWLALTLYVAGEIARRRLASSVAARWLNTLGCAAFIAHVACAFNFYHVWSHAVAYADTARQTAEMVGWSSGAGLYVNYFFAAVWLVDAFWSWITPSYTARPVWAIWAVRAFFWFMIFNGAVVFARGPMRGYGLFLSLALIASWWPRQRTSIDRPSCRLSI